jgi:hypothetical protein
VTALALFVIATPARAQFDTGQISGFVRDSSGGIVPGVTVTATNQGNGQQRIAVTNSEGFYVFPSLLVGSYDLAAEIAGFSRYTTRGVRVSAAARISVDVMLTVGSLSDTVEVQAAAILTESPVLGRTVGEQQIQQLPLSGRNPVFVARLQAGVVGGSLGNFGGTSIGTGLQSISGRGHDARRAARGHSSGGAGTHDELFRGVRARVVWHRAHGDKRGVARLPWHRD